MANPLPVTHTSPHLTRRGFLRGAGLGVAGVLLAACASDGDAPPADMTPEQFGAVGDGRTDDGPAVQRALDALTPGSRLRFADDRTYAHAGVLTLATAGTSLVGRGLLLAQDEERSALRVQADGVTVEDLRLGVAGTTRRWDAPDQHRLYVGPGTGLVLRRVIVTGSAASGVFLDGAADFRLEDLEVSDTRADGIHLTRGTRAGVVLRPRTARTGDDGVAVVSYLQDGAVCTDIEVVAPVVRTTTGGRGVSVVGGERITYRDIDIEDSAAAAVYLACEGDPYFTAPTRQVSVLGGRIRAANRDPEIDHGAILVFAGRDGGDVSDVTVTGLDVAGTRPTASRQVGVVVTAGTTQNVVLENLAVAGSPEPFSTNAPDTAPPVLIRGWTVDGRPTEITA